MFPNPYYLKTTKHLKAHSEYRVTYLCSDRSLLDVITG